MTPITEHPDYPIEKEQLERTNKFIRQYIEDNTPVLGHAADHKTAVVLAENQETLLQKIKDVEDQPYFGRVSWQTEEQDELETIYIGYTEINKMNIFSWRAPLPGKLYYEDFPNLRLRRKFDIDYGELKSFHDDFVHPDYLGHPQPKQEDPTISQYTDDMLLHMLSESRDGRLHDIVATIQKEQYRLIRSPEEKLLVVDGPPGSGKTQIALHRVAYLLYQHRNDQSPWKVLVLGPNRLFMDYAAQVLPALGERHIPQRAFDEWLKEMLGAEIVYEPQNQSLDLLLDQTVDEAEKVMRYRNAQNKSSLKMAQMLEQYVKLLRDEILGEDFLSISIRVKGEELTAKRTIAQLQEDIRQTASNPFNQQRENVEKRIITALTKELAGQVQTGPFGLDRPLLKSIRETVTEQVHRYFDSWHQVNVIAAYRRLLRNSRLMQKASDGVFTVWEQASLMQDPPTAKTPFRFGDLAALMYLKILLDGVHNRLRYDHIVIDEAQDMTPLQFKVLSEFSKQNSMTVLGDLSQGIYAHHGVSNWNDLAQGVIGEFDMELAHLKQSYRATKPLIDYANQLLKRIGQDKDMVLIVARPGLLPVQMSVSTLKQQSHEIVNAISQAKANGWHSIAVLGKTIADCKELEKQLREAGQADIEMVMTPETTYQGGLVIMPIHLAKGLEFDAVILPNANKESFPVDTLHARLLYVAITRASHELHIFWTGEISILLDSTKILSVPDLFGEKVQPYPVTIAEFARRGTSLDARWCVERLASADKLWLLEKGVIDKTVLTLFLRPYMNKSRQYNQEIQIQPLEDNIQRAISQHIQNVYATSEAKEGLIFSQIAYNLLRNQLRMLGLILPDEDKDNLIEQAILMATLWQALQTQQIPLTAGRWTTRNQTLNNFAPEQQKIAETQLLCLQAHGLVETSDQQLRVPSEQIPELLQGALGVWPDSWEDDLVTCLTKPPLSILKIMTEQVRSAT